MNGTVHAVDPQGMHVADDTVVNPLNGLLSTFRVPPHEAHTDLEVLLLGLFRSFEQPARGGMQRAMDAIFKMFPKEQY